MFELNEKIKTWRSGLAGQQSFEKTDIDELENHLREEIELLTLSELTEEEAFMVAAHRLGRSDSLSEEYAKVNTSILWRKRLSRVGIVVFGWLIVTYIGQVVSRICQILAVFIGLRGYTLNVIDLLSQVTFFVIIIFVVYRISRTKRLSGDSFFKIADSVRGKIVLFIIVFAIVLGTFTTKFLSSIVSARLLSAQELGQMSMFKVFQGLIQSIFLPLVLLLGVILVRPSKLRQAKR
ncbi:MAG: hypothetical protein JW715_16785 [Sedimentisphaerales bacterium]|nr:hypothetical protein [Sedimentisphaerales bacterium]